MNEHMRYLGVLDLLTQCSVYVPEEIRELIERAFMDAHKANPELMWWRTLNFVGIKALSVTPSREATGNAPLSPQDFLESERSMG